MPSTLVPPDSVAGRRRGAPPPFECSWTSGGLDAGWVRVAGALDIATAPKLARTLREPGLQTHLVVLDLHDLAFLDCSGVHAIVAASLRARHAGHRLVLLHGSARINRMFTLTGTSGDVEIGDLPLVEPPLRAQLQLATPDPAA
jgi:anti-sigma B factor antagonist